MSKPWMKLWASWWTRDEHRLLSTAQLGIAVRLMSWANQAEADERGTGWLLAPGGRPLTIDEIARICADVGPAEIDRLVSALVEAGTMTRRPDGAVGFVGFARSQESPSAAKMRKARAKVTRTVTSPVTVTDDVTSGVTTRGQKKRSKDEETKEEIQIARAQGTANDRSTDAQRPFNGRSPAEPAPRSAPADAGAVSQSVPPDASLTSVKAPQSADRPEPAPRGRRKDIVRPEPVQAPLAKWGPLAGDPTPTVEEVIEAWAQAGLPRPTKPSVELVIDRAVRLKPGRDLAWCKRLFARVAASPWCRGEVHDHPRCQAWSLAHTLGNERRISQVLQGKYDPEPARGRNKPALRNETQPEHRFTEITRKEAAEKAAAKARWTSADGWDEPPIEPMMIEEADEGYLIALTGEIH